MLFILGTHSVYVNHKTQAIRHKFNPISFMLAKKETYNTFFALMKSTKKILEVIECSRDVKCCISDLSHPVFKAYERAWPIAQFLPCWPHTIRKVTK